MLVVDAAVVVAWLVDAGADGAWAEEVCRKDVLVAPHFMPVEVANILRRVVRAGSITQEVGLFAHQRLLELPVGLVPYQPYAERVWELRHNLTPYDAWYVAVAESLAAKLATLDHRLRRASGPRCDFLVPRRH
jgi:predicted nucleic acid-binding protein